MEIEDYNLNITKELFSYILSSYPFLKNKKRVGKDNFIGYNHKIENKEEITVDIKKEQNDKILETQKEETQIKIVAVDNSNIRKEPNTQAEIVEVVKKDTQLQIEFCDKYDWCKLKDEEKYISKFLLN